MTALAAAPAVLWVAAPALLFAALHDVAFRTLPDWLSLGLAAVGCASRALDGSLGAGLACGSAVFLLAAACWRRGWLGGGDVKLLGACAILVPPSLAAGFVAAVALAGGLLAAAYLTLSLAAPVLPLRRSAPLARRVLAVECRRIRRRASLPYAAAIGAGAVLTLMRA